MRFLIGFVFIALFLLWTLYRLFIKRDLRQHKNDFLGMLFFCAIWGALYYFFMF